MQNNKINLTENQNKKLTEFVDLKRKIKQMTEQLKETQAEVLKMLSAEKFENVKIDLGYATIAKKEGYSKVSIDSAKLKELYPQIAKECEKTSYVSESLSVVFK